MVIWCYCVSYIIKVFTVWWFEMVRVYVYDGYTIVSLSLSLSLAILFLSIFSLDVPQHRRISMYEMAADRQSTKANVYVKDAIREETCLRYADGYSPLLYVCVSMPPPTNFPKTIS